MTLEQVVRDILATEILRLQTENEAHEVARARLAEQVVKSTSEAQELRTRVVLLEAQVGSLKGEVARRGG